MFLKKLSEYFFSAGKKATILIGAGKLDADL